MTRIGRIIASVVAISVGFVVLLGYIFPPLAGVSRLFLSWAIVVIAFSLLFGLVNLLRVHFNKITAREKGWFYSGILVISMAVTLLIGRNGPASAGGQTVFEYVLRPLESTLFALAIFFVASAAFRAFRIKNFETLLLVVFTIVVLLGQVPAGYQIWADLPLVKEWILRVPALAGARGILLGVALGTIATGLRVLLGADRPYADADTE